MSQYIFEVCLDAAGGDYRKAFELAYHLRFNRNFQDQYAKFIPSKDNDVNGVDKVLHFLTSAYLQYQGWGAWPAGVGKETWDELQKMFGDDEIGWSDADMHANARGRAFGEKMLDRQLDEADPMLPDPGLVPGL
jgi:hypothetical protein